MSYLKADIDELNLAIKLIDETIGYTDELKNDITNISNELASTWDGAASDYYVSKLRGHQKPVTNAKTALNEFRKYAVETRDDMVQIDKILDAFFGPIMELANKIKDILGGK